MSKSDVIFIEYMCANMALSKLRCPDTINMFNSLSIIPPSITKLRLKMEIQNHTLYTKVT